MFLNEIILLVASLIMFPVFLFVFVSELRQSSWNEMSFKNIGFIVIMSSVVYLIVGVWL